MGLASPIVIDCSHRLSHSPFGRAVRASNLRSFGRFNEILYLVEKTPTRIPYFARSALQWRRHRHQTLR
jgi:hypothetical protein